MTRGKIVVYLFLLSLAAFVAAVFVYTKAEDNTYTSAERKATEGLGDAKKANEKCDSLETKIDALTGNLGILERALQIENENRRNQIEQQTEVFRQMAKRTTDDLDILKVRQHTLEKNIIAKEKTLNLKIGAEPIQVEIVHRHELVQPKPQASPTPPPKSKDSLLKRSGVSP